MNGALGAWTPGQWRTDYHDEDCVGAWWDVSTAEGKQIICGLDHDEYMTERDAEQNMANFALIAAAPDLYDVLDDLMGLLVELQMGHDVSAIVDGNLREVLKVRAKARGEG